MNSLHILAIADYDLTIKTEWAERSEDYDDWIIKREETENTMSGEELMELIRKWLDSEYIYEFVYSDNKIMIHCFDPSNGWTEDIEITIKDWRCQNENNSR